MKYTPEEVIYPKQQEEFLDIARQIYRNDSNWVCPMDMEINGIFDPKKNPFFAHGTAIRWILRDKSGKGVGRVAAFINEKKAHNTEVPTGGMGFFECIEDDKSSSEFVLLHWRIPPLSPTTPPIPYKPRARPLGVTQERNS